jgi:REP element-mobilizing transposase RayT
MPDHIHLLIGIKPNLKISDMVRDVKTGSTHFIKKNDWNKHFAWQLGFGAFSYSNSQLETVVNYIVNQEKHHREKSFRVEYLTLLKRFNIQYNGKHLFEFFD